MLKQIRHSARVIRMPLLIALLAIGLGAVVIEQREVQVEQVTIRAGKGVMFAVVAKLVKNDKLDIVEKQSDGWLKVQVKEAEGFVWASALDAPKNGSLLSGIPGMGNLPANRNDPNASSAMASAAAKGLYPGTAFYANSNNYKTDGLEEMLAARDGVSGAPYSAFTVEGGVGKK